MTQVGRGETTLSVALVTRNRPKSLERTLSSLRRQDDQPFEVLVSDDSDAAFTGQVESVANKFGCEYVRGPHRGLYANRNWSALACRGTHVRTMDDDHEFPTGHVQACLDAIRGDPYAIWIVGERRPDEPASWGFQCPPQLHPRGFSLPPPGSGPIWAIADGSSIYPRSLFAQGHRLAESFPFGSVYLEWGSRLHWLGYRIRHLDTTYVIHHPDQGRSFSNREVELASRFFAMFAHAAIYQPTSRNRLLCALEVVKQTLTRGPLAIRSLSRGRRAYRDHRARALAGPGASSDRP